jgi:hypothetical protein
MMRPNLLRSATALVGLGLSAAFASAAVTTIDGPFGNDPLNPVVPPTNNPGGGTLNPTPDPQPPQFDFDNLLVNGDFATGDLFGWTFAGTPAWQVSTTQVGQNPFGPGNGNAFANTMSAGRFDLGSTSSLTQTVLLPGNIDPQVLVEFTAYSAFDSIDVHVDWLGPDPQNVGSLVVVRTDHLGKYGNIPTGSTDVVSQSLLKPDAATHVTFRATGNLDNGTWIDAGFDDARLTVATVVPEPAVATMLAVGGLIALRRR